MSLEERTATCDGCSEEFTYLRVTKRGGRPRTFCDKCIKKRHGQKRKATISMSDPDWELLDEIKRKLGVDTSEALRTSVRVYNALLKR